MTKSNQKAINYKLQFTEADGRVVTKTFRGNYNLKKEIKDLEKYGIVYKIKEMKK